MPWSLADVTILTEQISPSLSSLARIVWLMVILENTMLCLKCYGVWDALSCCLHRSRSPTHNVCPSSSCSSVAKVGNLCKLQIFLLLLELVWNLTWTCAFATTQILLNKCVAKLWRTTSIVTSPAGCTRTNIYRDRWQVWQQGNCFQSTGMQDGLWWGERWEMRWKGFLTQGKDCSSWHVWDVSVCVACVFVKGS